MPFFNREFLRALNAIHLLAILSVLNRVVGRHWATVRCEERYMAAIVNLKSRLREEISAACFAMRDDLQLHPTPRTPAPAVRFHHHRVLIKAFPLHCGCSK